MKELLAYIALKAIVAHIGFSMNMPPTAALVCLVLQFFSLYLLKRSFKYRIFMIEYSVIAAFFS
jgi:hypothetical protein